MSLVRGILSKTNIPSAVKWGSLLVTMLAIEITATVYLPVVKEFLFNGIEAKDWATFISGMWWFFSVIGIFCLCQGFKYYISHRVALLFRTGMVGFIKESWAAKLPDKAGFSNADQRIQEDTRLATESFIEMLIEIIISAAVIIGLVAQTWGSWHLLGLALGYSAIIMTLALVFHRPMVNSEKDLQRAEADFRFNLASIVMKAKDQCCKKEYKNVVFKYLYFIKVLMGFTLFNKVTGSLVSIIPFLLLVPLFFDGGITLGAVMKGVSQFDLIVLNATILVHVYPRFTKALASHERIVEFYRGLK